MKNKNRELLKGMIYCVETKIMYFEKNEKGKTKNKNILKKISD